MPAKVLLFAGAPEAHSLDWSSSGLINRFLDSIASFIEEDDLSLSSSRQADLAGTPDHAVWRSLPLERERLRTGFSQNHALARPYQGTPEFFTTLSRSFDTTSELSEDEPSRQIVNQFYDHSLAIHEDIPSSQLPSASLTTDESASFITDTSGDFSALGNDESTDYSLAIEVAQAAGPSHLRDLKTLPNAEYLKSIEPQTMTVNMIVGIISIAAPRTIITRWGKSMSLVELLVADETRSGFTVTFWLPLESDATNVTMKTLRRCDIVLLRNVALSVFNNKVHGHSLRKGLTRIDLLFRKRLDEEDQRGLYTMKDIISNKNQQSQMVKTRKVAEWFSHFVGDDGISLGKRKSDGKPVRRWDMPPADTQ
ncbi:hypothetical protein F5Y16DRAFT_365912 [Xylariaceae sp. FL0255]|nr:hypothetical protein F5Y16DRAFT_365912 [Xylariaceae sp. FL0255]